MPYRQLENTDRHLYAASLDWVPRYLCPLVCRSLPGLGSKSQEPPISIESNMYVPGLANLRLPSTRLATSYVVI